MSRTTQSGLQLEPYGGYQGAKVSCERAWWHRDLELSCATRAIPVWEGGGLRQRRNFGICLHRSTITTITAGLAREVCEACSHVSVRYVESAVKIHPNIEKLEFEEPTEQDLEETMVFEAMVRFEHDTRRLKCALCDQTAMFMIPEGLSCDEHAWQAAARLDWDTTDPWVPIRIDRSNA